MPSCSSRNSLKSSLKSVDVASLETTNPYVSLVQNQEIVEVPELELESGVTIHNFPIAYKTWGQINERGDNVLVVCHALTGSSDVADWWGPLLGPDLAFDTSRFLVVCLNSMGSPYGSFSPLNVDPDSGEVYGPEFPLCTVRDDVRAHKIVLDSLGVTSVACVIGGSMGGMLALEWAATFGREYVKNMVALATSARHSAWCISWSEAQRQSIYSDPNYLDGYYPKGHQPVVGLSAARMSALLTYRSRNSFEKKFSRRSPSLIHQQKSNKALNKTKPSSLHEHNLAIHNDGHSRSNSSNRERRNSESSDTSSAESLKSVSSATSTSSISSKQGKTIKSAQTYFSAQSYLRYQGKKFIQRFDANCYISITRKLDTHDLARDRTEYEEELDAVLESIQQPSLIIGIKSDGLFTYSEQEYLAAHMPKSELKKIDSPEGHDAFLLEFKLINEYIIDFLKKNVSEITSSPPCLWRDDENREVMKASLFGEAEEVTNW
ncbi:LAME_0G01882g1_1 [Lachancea meyersii CBS 8951]|uniref:LAME_0G01882g1_1 n=1 Tax=Lachancea meyersii CBS 8951 TaxID=1266667 RepID=A0A1G4K5P1_9SACH|nr:LAME_0G01882g1_1 [Lachancea meyersii CBS 8951]